MTTPSTDPREQQQRDAEQAQLDAKQNQQKAEQNELTGRQQNDGLRDHQGTGAARGQ